MPRLKCKMCGQDFFIQSRVAQKQEYCDNCKPIKEKIDKGKACPNCGTDWDIAMYESCPSCSYLFGNKIFCVKCGERIILNKDRYFLSVSKQDPYCKKCYEEKIKEPDPETTDQKLDRLIECHQRIAESIKTIAEKI